MSIETAELIIIYPKSLGELTLFKDVERSSDFLGTPRFKTISAGAWNDPQTSAISLEIDDLPVGARFFASIVPSV